MITKISVIACIEGKLHRKDLCKSDLPDNVSLFDLVTGPYEEGTNREFYLRK